MSNFAKPSLKELRNRAISNINTYLQGADANLRRRILNIFATIFAAMGDEVTLDFEGFVDGVAFEGGKAENATLNLCSNTFRMY